MADAVDPVGGGRERGRVRNVSSNVGSTRFGGRGVGDGIDLFEGVGEALRLSTPLATLRLMLSEDVNGGPTGVSFDFILLADEATAFDGGGNVFPVAFSSSAFTVTGPDSASSSSMSMTSMPLSPFSVMDLTVSDRDEKNDVHPFMFAPSDETMGLTGSCVGVGELGEGWASDGKGVGGFGRASASSLIISASVFTIAGACGTSVGLLYHSYQPLGMNHADPVV